MKDANKKLRVKILAPAATLSEFSMVSADLDKPIDASRFVGNSVEEMADIMIYGQREKLLNNFENYC